jgi:hypothetical protein
MPWRIARFVEGAGGVLTLAAGLSMLVMIGFGRWSCQPADTACTGLLGPVGWGWLDIPSVVTVWLPFASAEIIGVGALLSALGRRSVAARLRWVALCGLAVPTLILLVVSPAGVGMIPVFGIAFVTVAVGQARARHGDAPSSLAGVVSGAVATVACALVVFLSGRHTLLLLGA